VIVQLPSDSGEVLEDPLVEESADAVTEGRVR
jgi:hypothetical protein